MQKIVKSSKLSGKLNEDISKENVFNNSREVNNSINATHCKKRKDIGVELCTLTDRKCEEDSNPKKKTRRDEGELQNPQASREHSEQSELLEIIDVETINEAPIITKIAISPIIENQNTEKISLKDKIFVLKRDLDFCSPFNKFQIAQQLLTAYSDYADECNSQKKFIETLTASFEALNLLYINDSQRNEFFQKMVFAYISLGKFHEAIEKALEGLSKLNTDLIQKDQLYTLLIDTYLIQIAECIKQNAFDEAKQAALKGLNKTEKAYLNTLHLFKLRDFVIKKFELRSKLFTLLIDASIGKVYQYDNLNLFEEVKKIANEGYKHANEADLEQLSVPDLKIKRAILKCFLVPDDQKIELFLQLSFEYIQEKNFFQAEQTINTGLALSGCTDAQKVKLYMCLTHIFSLREMKELAFVIHFDALRHAKKSESSFLLFEIHSKFMSNYGPYDNIEKIMLKLLNKYDLSKDRYTEMMQILVEVKSLNL